MTRILAIDQSTKLVGWAYFVNGQLMFSGHDKLDAVEDISSIVNNMKEYTLNHLWNKEPTLVVTEDPMSLARVNPKVCFKLTMSLAGMVAACDTMGVQLELLSPTMIKKHISGKGNANKDLVRESVSQKIGRPIESEDEADAIAIGYTILSRIATPYPTQKSDVIENIHT